MARLFISYARRDGRQLAERLESDLKAHAHEPWMDRAEIQGGTDWSQAIEGAIDRCEALLAVLTPGSFQSTICRGEQERALRKHKRVVPLLAQQDADRPIYLESAHYLDFTDSSTYGPQFKELLGCIRDAKGLAWDDLSPRARERLSAEVPVRSMAASLRGRQADWTQVRSMTATQRARFLEGLSPRRGTTGIFEPALYIHRTDEECELERFVSGEALALMLIGGPGVGKTNLLCHWSGEQADAGHAILMYQCERLATADVERELTKDLELEEPTALAEVLAYIDELAGQAGRRLIIVFDGINDFRGRQGEGPKQLLTGIDSLVSRLSGTNLRVALSCSTATWNRLDRLGPLRLTWSRYHRTPDDAEFLPLDDFDAGEADAAYQCYRNHFGLTLALSDLPPRFRLRLREPVLLRLFAEAQRTSVGPGAETDFDAPVFKRYYEERVRHREDQMFLDELAGEMLARENAALPVQALSRHAQLGKAILSEEANSSYHRLLDEGVLLEVRGDLFNDDLLKFAYPLVGAYALAQRLLSRDEPLNQTVRGLVARAGKLPLAWDAAVTLLTVRGDLEVYAEFAGATDSELRELATESLTRMQGADQERTREILNGLLDSNSPQQQRSALRAAFNIGPATRDLLVRGALSGSETLRQAVRDTLYLIWSGVSRSEGGPRASTVYFIWRHAPDFTHRLMRDLVEQVTWRNPIEAARVLRFVLDLSITIYVNHCERAEVAQQTADLFHELTVNRLHLDRLNLGPIVERIVFKAVASVFSRRLLHWMLLAELEDPDRFFHIPVPDRKPLARITPYLDPTADVLGAEDLVLDMLRSEVNVYRGAATLAMAIHSYENFARCESVHRRLFEALDPQGRVWQLVGFAVLLPATPVAWVALLEEMTRRVLEEHPDVAYGRTGLLKVFDILLVPLGLSYGKRGDGMPLFEELLAKEISTGKHERSARLVAGLGPVGFYYPQAVLAALGPHMTALVAQSVSRQALVTTFATMRALHFDLVDGFIVHAGLDESFRHQVAVTTDVALINRFMTMLGYFNNSVHFCLYYPCMRRGLAVFPLEKLAEAGSASDFIAAYAGQAINMAREANFQLLAWTRPD